MERFIATKPVRFDRNYAIGEVVPGAVIDPRRVKGLVERGKIAIVTETDTQEEGIIKSGDPENSVAFVEELLGVEHDDEKDLPPLENRVEFCKEVIVEIKNTVAHLKATYDNPAGEEQEYDPNRGDILPKYTYREILNSLVERIEGALEIQYSDGEKTADIQSRAAVCKAAMEDAAKQLKGFLQADSDPDFDGERGNLNDPTETPLEDENGTHANAQTVNITTPLTNTYIKVQDGNVVEKTDEYICQICGKVCTTKSGLSAHMKTHDKS
jgi:hypothetical protein